MFELSMTKKEKREVEIVERLLPRTEPLGAAEAERLLGEQSLLVRVKVLGLTPPDANPRVVASAVVDCLEWPLIFQSVSKLSDGVWREVMKRLSRNRRAMGPTAAFLMEATRGASDEALPDACRAAVDASLRLGSVKHFTSARARRTLAELAARPEILRACQALVVADPMAQLSMVAVVVLDGSTDSLDALIQFMQFEPPEKRCRELAKLVPATSQVARLLLGPRQTGASAAAFSKSLGLPAGHAKVDVWLESVRADGGEGRLAACFTLDPSARSWWWVWVDRARPGSLFESDGTVAFGSEGVGDDELKGKPPSAVEQVPAWLAAFGQRNKVTWRLERRVEGRLSPRGKARLVEWLLGAPP